MRRYSGVCPEPGCPQLRPCSVHGDRSPSSRVTSTSAWRRLRDQVLERDGCRCVRCGSTDRLQVHHRHPVAHGGQALPHRDQLETLCGRCHGRAHSASFLSPGSRDA